MLPCIFDGWRWKITFFQGWRLFKFLGRLTADGKPHWDPLTSIINKNSAESRPSDKGVLGGGHPDPEIRGKGVVSKFFASVWSKNKWWGGGGGMNPQGPPWVRYCKKNELAIRDAASYPIVVFL